MAFLQVPKVPGDVYLQAWEELMQGAARKATRETAAEPAATGLEAKSKDGGDADEEQKDGAGPGTVEESKSAGAQGKNEDGGEADEEPGSAHEDFSALISSEVKDLKDKRKQPFVGYDTGIKTCLFVHMPLVSESTPGPNEVCDRTSERIECVRFHLRKTAAAPSRWVLLCGVFHFRFLGVQVYLVYSISACRVTVNAKFLYDRR